MTGKFLQGQLRHCLGEKIIVTRDLFATANLVYIGYQLISGGPLNIPNHRCLESYKKISVLFHSYVYWPISGSWWLFLLLL